MRRTINIMCGVPGSGKTTYATNKSSKGMYCGRDSLRKLIRAEMNTDKYFPVSQTEETVRWFQFLHSVLQYDNSDIWIDQTTIGHGALTKILTGIHPHCCPDDEIVIHIMNTSLEDCLLRNTERQGHERVPEKVIEGMYRRFEMEPLSDNNVAILAEDAGFNPANVRVVRV